MNIKDAVFKTKMILKCYMSYFVILQDSCRVVIRRSKRAMGLLIAFEEFSKNKCCVDNCVKVNYFGDIKVNFGICDVKFYLKDKNWMILWDIDYGI